MSRQRSEPVNGRREDWGTPTDLFLALDALWGPLDLDAAANEANTKCRSWISAGGVFVEGEDGTVERVGPDTNALDPSLRWSDYSSEKKAFLNPPYGRNTTEKWLKVAAAQARNGGLMVVCLVPASVGSQWFRRAIGMASEVVFLVGRIRFESAPASADFDSALIVYGRTPEQAPLCVWWWDWRKEP